MDPPEYTAILLGGGVTHYIYNIRNLLWPLYLISTGGVLTIYKKDLWKNNDLVRSHELFQYISQMLLVKSHFGCLYIYERVFRQAYSCRYGSNIEI